MNYLTIESLGKLHILYLPVVKNEAKHAPARTRTRRSRLLFAALKLLRLRLQLDALRSAILAGEGPLHVAELDYDVHEHQALQQ